MPASRQRRSILRAGSQWPSPDVSAAASSSLRCASVVRRRPCEWPSSTSAASIRCQPSIPSGSMPRSANSADSRSDPAARHQGAVVDVVQQRGDGLDGIGLVGADDAGRTSLHPAGDVLVSGEPAVADHPSLGVRAPDRCRRRAEPRPAARPGSRPSAPPAGRGSPAARPRPTTAPSSSSAVRSTSTPSTRSPPRIRTGRVQKCRCSRRDAAPVERSAHSRSTTRLRAATLSRATTARLGRVQLEVERVDQQVDVGDLTELAQLLGGEGGVRRAASTEDVHVGDLLVIQRVEHLVGHVGVGELRRRAW